MDDPFKLSSSNSSTGKKKQTNQSASFLEALREQSRSATTGVASSFVEQITGNPSDTTKLDKQPNQQAKAPANPNTPPFNFAEFLRMREQKVRQQERMLHQQQQRTETLVFHQKEESARKEIELIKEEIRKIIESSTEISSELISAEQSVMTTTVEVGTYQINFFQRIRRMLVLIRKRLSESKHWLEEFNSRKKNRSHYWGQVQKSGTKFILSHERYVATQTG